MLLAFMLTLLTFLSPAQAESLEVLTFAVKPNLVLPAGTQINPEHYRIVLYEELANCPLYLDAAHQFQAFVLDDSLKDQRITLDPDKEYAVGTYMHTNAGWDLIVDSCRPIESMDALRTPYAAYINRLPNPAWFSTTVMFTLPLTQPGYRLVQQTGSTCPDKFENRGGNLPGTALDQPLSSATATLSVGSWTYGVYNTREPYVLYAHRPEFRDFQLVPGTCKAIVVNDFSQVVTYEPQLPAHVLAGYVPSYTVPSVSLSLSALGTYDEVFIGGARLQAQYRGGIPSVVLMAAFELELSTLAPLPTMLSGGGELGIGYSLTHELTGPLPLQWDVILSGGLGRIMTRCTPGIYTPEAQLVCGSPDGFPLVLTAPWIGPTTSARVLSPVRSIKGKTLWIGPEITAGVQVYLLRAEGETTLDTTSGTQQAFYSLESAVLAQPYGSMGLVGQW